MDVQGTAHAQSGKGMWDLQGARVLLQLYMVAGCPSISETVNSLS